MAQAWRWIDRDLDTGRPISGVLIVVPFIPYGFALEFAERQETRDALFIGGIAVALPWMLYTIWRGLKAVSRSFRTATSHFRDLQLTPRQRLWRLVQGIVAAAVCGGAIIYLYHLG